MSKMWSLLRTLDREIMICKSVYKEPQEDSEMQLPNTQPSKQTSHDCSIRHLRIFFKCYTTVFCLDWYIYIDIITRRQHIETFIYICTGQALANSFIAFCSQDQNLANRMQSACKFRTLRAQQSQDCFSCSPRLGWVPGTRLRPFSLSHVVQEFPIFHR